MGAGGSKPTSAPVKQVAKTVNVVTDTGKTVVADCQIPAPFDCSEQTPSMQESEIEHEQRKTSKLGNMVGGTSKAASVFSQRIKDKQGAVQTQTILATSLTREEGSERRANHLEKYCKYMRQWKEDNDPVLDEIFEDAENCGEKFIPYPYPGTELSPEMLQGFTGNMTKESCIPGLRRRASPDSYDLLGQTPLTADIRCKSTTFSLPVHEKWLLVADIYGRLPIHVACENGRLDYVIAITSQIEHQNLEDDADLEEEGASGLESLAQIDNTSFRTPLSWAIYNRHVDIVNFLVENLKQYACKNISVQDVYGWNALSRDNYEKFYPKCNAVVREFFEELLLMTREQRIGEIQPQFVDFLTPDTGRIERVQVPYHTLEDTDNPCYASKRHAAFCFHDLQPHRQLSHDNVAQSCHDEFDWLGSGSAHRLVIKRHPDIAKLRAFTKEQLEERNRVGQTCLHIASQNGNLEVVKLLLEKGVDVNAYDGEGYTALLLALRSNNMSVAEKLCDPEDQTFSNASEQRITYENDYKAFFHWRHNPHPVSILEHLPQLHKINPVTALTVLDSQEAQFDHDSLVNAVFNISDRELLNKIIAKVSTYEHAEFHKLRYKTLLSIVRCHESNPTTMPYKFGIVQAGNPSIVEDANDFFGDFMRLEHAHHYVSSMCFDNVTRTNPSIWFGEGARLNFDAMKALRLSKDQTWATPVGIAIQNYIPEHVLQTHSKEHIELEFPMLPAIVGKGIEVKAGADLFPGQLIGPIKPLKLNTEKAIQRYPSMNVEDSSIDNQSCRTVFRVLARTPHANQTKIAHLIALNESWISKDRLFSGAIRELLQAGMLEAVQTALKITPRNSLPYDSRLLDAMGTKKGCQIHHSYLKAVNVDTLLTADSLVSTKAVSDANVDLILRALMYSQWAPAAQRLRDRIRWIHPDRSSAARKDLQPIWTLICDFACAGRFQLVYRTNQEEYTLNRKLLNPENKIARLQPDDAAEPIMHKGVSYHRWDCVLEAALFTANLHMVSRIYNLDPEYYQNCVNQRHKAKLVLAAISSGSVKALSFILPRVYRTDDPDSGHKMSIDDIQLFIRHAAHNCRLSLHMIIGTSCKVGEKVKVKGIVDMFGRDVLDEKVTYPTLTNCFPVALEILDSLTDYLHRNQQHGKDIDSKIFTDEYLDVVLASNCRFMTNCVVKRLMKNCAMVQPEDELFLEKLAIMLSGWHHRVNSSYREKRKTTWMNDTDYCNRVIRNTDPDFVDAISLCLPVMKEIRFNTAKRADFRTKLLIRYVTNVIETRGKGVKPNVSLFQAFTNQLMHGFIPEDLDILETALQLIQTIPGCNFRDLAIEAFHRRRYKLAHLFTLEESSGQGEPSLAYELAKYQKKTIFEFVETVKRECAGDLDMALKLAWPQKFPYMLQHCNANRVKKILLAFMTPKFVDDKEGVFTVLLNALMNGWGRAFEVVKHAVAEETMNELSVDDFTQTICFVDSESEWNCTAVETAYFMGRSDLLALKLGDAGDLHTWLRKAGQVEPPTGETAELFNDCNCLRFLYALSASKELLKTGQPPWQLQLRMASEGYLDPCDPEKGLTMSKIKAHFPLPEGLSKIFESRRIGVHELLTATKKIKTDYRNKLRDFAYIQEIDRCTAENFTKTHGCRQLPEDVEIRPVKVQVEIAEAENPAKSKKKSISMISPRHTRRGSKESIASKKSVENGNSKTEPKYHESRVGFVGNSFVVQSSVVVTPKGKLLVQRFDSSADSLDNLARSCMGDNFRLPTHLAALFPETSEPRRHVLRSSLKFTFDDYRVRFVIGPNVPRQKVLVKLFEKVSYEEVHAALVAIDPKFFSGCLNSGTEILELLEECLTVPSKKEMEPKEKIVAERIMRELHMVRQDVKLGPCAGFGDLLVQALVGKRNKAFNALMKYYVSNCENNEDGKFETIKRIDDTDVDHHTYSSTAPLAFLAATLIDRHKKAALHAMRGWLYEYEGNPIELAILTSARDDLVKSEKNFIQASEVARAKKVFVEQAKSQESEESDENDRLLEMRSKIIFMHN